MLTHNRITSRIVFGTVLGIVPVLIAAAVILTRLNQGSLRDAYRANVSNALKTALDDQERYVAHFVEAWVSNPSFETALESAISYGDPTSLEARAVECQKSSGYDALRIYDVQGGVLAHADTAAGAGIAVTGAVKAVLSSGKAAAEVTLAGHKIVVAALTPISIAGKPAGVVALLNLIDTHDLERVGNSLGASVAIAQGEQILAASEASLHDFKPDSAMAGLASSSGKPQQALTPHAGRDEFVTYVPLAQFVQGGGDVCAIVFSDASTYLSARRTAQITWLIAGLAVIGVVILVAAFVGGRIGNSIRQAVQQLEESADQVATSAEQIRDAGRGLAEGSNSQAAAIEETSASLEEMASMTKRNAEAAQQAKGLASETRGAADTGATDMDAMKAAMDDIKRSSDDISKIIKTIDEIAFQTNILALNAAVEAARAGEAGMGFAVVADEVRTLAQRSAQSARETASKIEEAIDKSARGVHISNQVAASLGQIVDKARRVDTLVAEIATASHEQNQGIGQVNNAVGQMDKVTQANAASAEETAAAATELTRQSAAMQSAVAALRAIVSNSGERPAAKAQTRAPETMTHHRLDGHMNNGHAINSTNGSRGPIKTIVAGSRSN